MPLCTAPSKAPRPSGRPADAEVSINGVRLGTDPTPVLHGDKIQIFEHEILAVDPQRAGNTQLFDSGAFADLPRPRLAKPPSGADRAAASFA